MKKIAVILSCSVLVFFTCIYLSIFAFTNMVLADENDYELSLTHISNSDIEKGETTINTKAGNPISFAFSNSSALNDGIISLSSNGEFKNVTKISGITRIKGLLSSEMNLRYGNDEALDYGSTILNTSFDYVLEFPSDYFILETTEGSAIQELSITYSCYSSDKPVIRDNNHTLSYMFKGNEMNEKGYGEGEVSLNHLTGFSKGDTYSFYWGNTFKKLDNMYPLYTYQVTSSIKDISFEIAENISIPHDAKSLVAYKGDELVCLYTLPINKLSNDEIIYKSATISDVHMNYTQGEKHLLDALNRFEDQGVQYIIITGDIGETSAHFDKYRSACISSKYTGLIFTCPGNHDQKSSSSISLYDQYAMYDGMTSTFIDIESGPSYFAATYNGSLPVEVTYVDVEGSNNTHYYYATIGDNLYFFMDLTVLNASGDDRFSSKQLDYLESILHNYSGDHSDDVNFDYDEYNIYIVEHAPFKQFKVGDTFNPGYGGQLEIAPSLTSNYRFGLLLKEYYEAIMLTGHTHVKYETAINFVDRYYDLTGTLTNEPFARTFHVSSLAMPRWYEIVSGKNKMTTHDNFTAMSEGYIVYEYNDRTVYEATCFKEYTPSNSSYDPSLFGSTTYSAESYVFPKLVNNHSSLTDYAESSFISSSSGTPYISDLIDSTKISFSENDSVIFNLSNLDVAYDKNESIYFLVEVNSKTFTLSGIDDSDQVSKEVDIDFDSNSNKYRFSVDGDKFLLQVKVKDLFDKKLSTYRIKLSNHIGDLYLYSLRVKQTYDITARGIKSFVENIDTSIMFEEKSYVSIQFDYRIEVGTKFTMCVMTDDWQDYFGYWDFNASGAVSSYAGVTTNALTDGYIRVNIDFLTCVKKGKPINVDRFYIRGSYTNSYGYIDNIVLTEGEVVPPTPSEDRGTAFSGGVDGNFSLTPVTNATHLTFEYRIDSGDHFNVSFFNADDWHSYFGYYEFDKNGSNGSYKGISTEKLEDGYIKVTASLANLNFNSAGSPFPSEPINYLYIRGAWTDASGYIDNITLENRGDPIIYRGQSITSGKDFELKVTPDSYTTITFEYYIENGDHFNLMIAHNDDWNHYRGYYEFNAKGAASSYQGISTTPLEDNYIRVTMNYLELNKTGSKGAPTLPPGLFYIRGATSNANGYIDNIVFA